MLLESAYNDICMGGPELVVSPGASLIGWCCEFEGVTAGGQWLPAEQAYHINYLEVRQLFWH